MGRKPEFLVQVQLHGLWQRKSVMDLFNKHLNGSAIQSNLVMIGNIGMAKILCTSGIPHWENPILTNLAIHTVSCIPSAMAAYRSFSIQKNIPTTKRNQLSSTKAAQIMFIKWNDDLLSGRSSLDKNECMNCLCKSSIDMQKLEDLTDPSIPLQINEEDSSSLFPQPPL